MTKRYTKETFLIRVKELYGDLYDFSEMNYVNQSTKIKVICSKHGEFYRAPTDLVRNRRCYECAKESSLLGSKKSMSDEAKLKRKETNLRKYGATTYAGSNQARVDYINGSGPWSKDSRLKAANTNIERYGSKTWAESDVGRNYLKDMTSSSEIRKEMSIRMKKALVKRDNTNLKRYGVKSWVQSEEGKKRLIELFNDPLEREARSNRLLDPTVRAKIESNGVRKYGVPYYWQTEEGKFRLRSKEIISKKRKTMRKNGSFHVSKSERELYQMLINHFGEDDVIEQYNDFSRYPFNCDFYIKSLDLFIELNAYWTHGGHWFNPNDENDVNRLNKMTSFIDEKHSYLDAINIWTVRDPMKREIALNNKLNYLVFWDNNLNDAKEWFSNNCSLNFCEK